MADTANKTNTTDKTNVIQIYEIAGLNLIEFASIYNDFIDTENIKDLTVQYMDKNGEIKTITIKNVAAIRKEIAADLEALKEATQKADAKLADKITTVETKFTQIINDEIERAKTAEAALDKKIENNISEIASIEKDVETKYTDFTDFKKETNNNITTLDSKITQEIKDRQDADKALDKKFTESLADETNAREEADSKLQIELNQEIEDRKAADAQLQKDLTNLITLKVTNEETARKAADGSLKFNDDIVDKDGNQPDNLTDAINDVDNRLNAEVKELKTADENLKKYIDTKISEIIGGAPEALDTLKELADALNDDADFAKDIVAKINDLKTTLENEVKAEADARAKADEDTIKAAKSYTDTEVKAEADARAKADGSLKFNDDIKNDDGSTPDNLTDAINDVDNKVNNELNKEIKDRKAADEELKTSLGDEVKAEADARAKADGSLKFNDDIKNDDGSTPDNLTDAINDVDNKVIKDLNGISKQLGNLKFDNNIKNSDGTQPNNITDAINDINKKIDDLYNFLGIQKV